MPRLNEILGESFSKISEDLQKKYKDVNLVDSTGYVEKTELDTANSSIKDYKKQLKDRDTQLEDLKGKANGNEELSAEIERLKAENTKVSQDYEAKINQINFDTKFEKALDEYKPKNNKALKALLDMEKVKLDGDAFLGLEDQIKSLKESDSYLFEPEIQGGTGKIGTSTMNNTSTTNNAVGDEVKTIGGMLAKAKVESMTNTESSFFK